LILLERAEAFLENQVFSGLSKSVGVGSTPAERTIFNLPLLEGEMVYFAGVKATLTELRRDTSRITRVADEGNLVILTKNGKPRYRLAALKQLDRKAAAIVLQAIGQ